MLSLFRATKFCAVILVAAIMLTGASLAVLCRYRLGTS